MRSPKIAEHFERLTKTTAYKNAYGELRMRLYVGKYTRICYILTYENKTREVWQTCFDKEDMKGESYKTWNTAASRKGNLHVQIDECSNAEVFKRKANNVNYFSKRCNK